MSLENDMMSLELFTSNLEMMTSKSTLLAPQKPILYTMSGKCSTPSQLLICSSFSRENGMLICSFAHHDSPHVPLFAPFFWGSWWILAHLPGDFAKCGHFLSWVIFMCTSQMWPFFELTCDLPNGILVKSPSAPPIYVQILLPEWLPRGKNFPSQFNGPTPYTRFISCTNGMNKWDEHHLVGGFNPFEKY